MQMNSELKQMKLNETINGINYLNDNEKFISEAFFFTFSKHET